MQEDLRLEDRGNYSRNLEQGSGVYVSAGYPGDGEADGEEAPGEPDTPRAGYRRLARGATPPSLHSTSQVKTRDLAELNGPEVNP